MNLDRIFKRHGIEIVYRIAYALAAAYAFMFICTLCWPFLHHMFLLVFILVLAVFVYVFVWGIKSNAFLSGFRNVARIASFFYLILQAMSLVDMSFTFHEFLIDKIDDTNVYIFYFFYIRIVITILIIHVVARISTNHSMSSFHAYSSL